MKKLLLILLAVFMLGSILSACAPADYPDGFSDEKAQQLDEVMRSAGIYDSEEKPGPWYQRDGLLKSCYLYYENGCDIFYHELHGEYRPNMDTDVRHYTMYYLRVAEQLFYPASSRAVWVHKDGAVYSLKEAYEQGLVSDEGVRAAREMFDKCVYEMRTADPFEVLETEFAYMRQKYADDPQMQKYLDEYIPQVWEDPDNKGSGYVTDWEFYFDEDGTYRRPETSPLYKDE